MELTIVDDKEKIGPVESAVIKMIGVGDAGWNAVN